jgi:hypothetical protein
MSDLHIPADALAAINATSQRKKEEAEAQHQQRSPQEGALRWRPRTPIIIREAADLTEEMLPAISELTDDLCPDPDQRVDWEQFADYLERWENIVVADLDCPAFRKLQRIVRRLREQA